MPFRSGQFLVHPAHGLVRVEQVAPRRVAKVTEQYLHLAAVSQQLQISIPVRRVADVGIRSLVTAADAEDLLEVLRAPSSAVGVPWSRRLKDFQLRVASGELRDRCVVIREITRAGVKAPASAEGMLLRTTRTLLAHEFAAALGITAEDAATLIDAAARGETVVLPTFTCAAVEA